MQLSKVLTFFLILFLLSVPTHAQNDPLRAITAEDTNRLGVLTLLARHTAPIVEMAFSPMGSAFTTGSLDGEFCVWNVIGRGVAPGKLLFCLPHYNPGVTLHQWAADERHLAITSTDGLTISLYTVTRAVPQNQWNDFEPELEFSTGEAPFLTLDFVGNSLLAYDIFDTYTLHNIENGEVLISVEGLSHAIAGEQIALLTFDDQVILIDGNTGEETGRRGMPDIRHLEFSANGSWLAGWGQRVYVWNLRTSPRIFTITPDNIQFTPNSRWMATWEGEIIRFWDMTTREITGTLEEHQGGVQSLIFSPNSQRAISIDSAGRGRLWDISETGIIQQRLVFINEIDRAIIGPDSISAVVTRHDFLARFYDIERGQLRGNFEFSPESAFSPDWTLVATQTNSLVTWYGLRDDPRQFDWQPLGFTNQATNVRATPSTEQARIALLPANSPIFAFEKTLAGDWLHILLSSGIDGWIFTPNIELQGSLEDLPIAR